MEARIVFRLRFKEVRLEPSYLVKLGLRQEHRIKVRQELNAAINFL